MQALSDAMATRHFLQSVDQPGSRVLAKELPDSAHPAPEAGEGQLIPTFECATTRVQLEHDDGLCALVPVHDSTLDRSCNLQHDVTSPTSHSTSRHQTDQ